MELVKPSRVICMLYAETAHMEFHSAKKKKYLVGARYAALQYFENIALLSKGFTLHFLTFSLERSWGTLAQKYGQRKILSLSLMTKTFLNAVSAANSPGMR